MKRIGAIVSLSLMIVLLVSTSLCFAADLEITDTYPKEGQSNLQNVNCGVKLWFNEDMYSKENVDQLAQHFEIVDEKGKKISTSVLSTDKEKNMVLVLAKKDLVENAAYQLHVSGELTSADGDVLGKDMKLNFRTRDASADMTVNMVLMVVMFVGIMFFSTKAMKKQAEKEQKEKDDKVNPYKIAKETGKPVEEVIEKLEKEKEKKARAQARKQGKGKSGGDVGIDGSSVDNDNKRVTGPRPISAGGSTYVSGRKAKAEAEAAAKAAARAKGTTNPKNKGKGKKKK